MSEKLSKNLNLLMNEAHLNAEELSRRVGVNASTIKKMRNNHDANPTLSTLLPIAKFFSLTIDQLVGNEPFPKSRIKGSYEIAIDRLHHIPLITWEDAITWPATHEQQSYSTITTEREYSKNAYALLVIDDDWENLVKNTALIIDPTIEVEHRDFVIVYKKGQKIPTLKQALFDEGQIYLKPMTQVYNITVLTPEHNVLGTVVEYKKYLKNT